MMAGCGRCEEKLSLSMRLACRRRGELVASWASWARNAAWIVWRMTRTL